MFFKHLLSLLLFWMMTRWHRFNYCETINQAILNQQISNSRWFFTTRDVHPFCFFLTSWSQIEKTDLSRSRNKMLSWMRWFFVYGVTGQKLRNRFSTNPSMGPESWGLPRCHGKHFMRLRSVSWNMNTKQGFRMDWATSSKCHGFDENGYQKVLGVFSSSSWLAEKLSEKSPGQIAIHNIRTCLKRWRDEYHKIMSHCETSSCINLFLANVEAIAEFVRVLKAWRAHWRVQHDIQQGPCDSTHDKPHVWFTLGHEVELPTW